MVYIIYVYMLIYTLSQAIPINDISSLWRDERMAGHSTVNETKVLCSAPFSLAISHTNGLFHYVSMMLSCNTTSKHGGFSSEILRISAERVWETPKTSGSAS